MLKIKDNVDLKELEKFGFVKITCLRYKYSGEYWVGEHYEVEVADKPLIYARRILKYDNDNANIPSIIFDLIQAGLVEKV